MRTALVEATKSNIKHSSYCEEKKKETKDL